MALPGTGSISTAQILAELQVANPSRAYPLSLTDADVRTLVAKPTGAVILPTDFYGKSSESYSISPDVTTVIEGTSVVFTISTVGVPNGTSVSWNTINTALTTADFTDAIVSGTVSISINSATITRTLSSDLTTEGTQSFQIQISVGGVVKSTSSTVNVLDTSPATAAATFVTTSIILQLDAESYSGSGDWIDTSGTLNDGLLQGTPTFNSVSPKSFTLNGTSQFISTKNSFNNPSTFTIGVWFRTNSTSQGKKIIGFENQQTTTSTVYDRHIWIGTDGRLRVGQYPGSFVQAQTDFSKILPNIWYYVVARYSGANLRLFLNGTEVGAVGNLNSGEPITTGYWRIGSFKLNGWSSGSDGYFSGQIAYVHIHQVDLSSAEILNNFNALRSRYSV